MESLNINDTKYLLYSESCKDASVCLMYVAYDYNNRARAWFWVGQLYPFCVETTEILLNMFDCFHSAHQVDAEAFMVRDVYFLSMKSTYNYAWELLQLHSVRAYPLVDNEGLLTASHETTIFLWQLSIS